MAVAGHSLAQSRRMKGAKGREADFLGGSSVQMTKVKADKKGSLI